MTSERDMTTHPSRVIVGHCPKCEGVVVVANEYGVWPLVWCPCGWKGPTTEIKNHTRLERNGVIIDIHHQAIVVLPLIPLPGPDTTTP